MLCKVAHESRTMRQMDVNVEFLHNEFGMRAGFPWASCAFIQMTKRGIMATAITNNRMFAGCSMLDGLSAITLYASVSDPVSSVGEPWLRESIRQQAH